MNRGISGAFYVGWFFIWVTLLYPEMVTRITAVGATGTIGTFLATMPFIFLVMALAVPIYIIWKGD